MNLPEINADYLLNTLSDLLNTPSPSGFTQRAVQLTQDALAEFPALQLTLTRKGALLAVWPGARADSPRALTAHLDTLGAMVKEIKANGRLKLTKIGGYAWNTVEGEGCKVFPRQGKALRGSLLIQHASTHVHGAAVGETKRDDENMEVRLDARTTSRAETEALGVHVGDCVAFDPRMEIREGFVRSRHLDDKACVACLLAAVKALHDAGLQPTQTAYLFISNFEEVGHGASAGIPADAAEMLVVDMAAVGEGQASDEFHATLCLKDSGGPYHQGLSERLRRIAEEQGIDYLVDIYPYYGSDGGAALRAGSDIQVALIGPGVDASHNYERTHLDALLATARWIAAYLLS
ncbi:MAG: M42 family metallopeptidase [Chloroflexi bacterium]|nr:M42 family metallopeptidase [Chloroflexota bacterium]